MTTETTVYFRLSAAIPEGKLPTSVTLENMDGSKVAPEIQQAIGIWLQEQAKEREYVYIAKSHNPEQLGYKVGRTKNLQRRERELGAKVILAIECDTWGDFCASQLESDLHELYTLAGLKLSREWFDLTWWDIELLRVFFDEELTPIQIKDGFLTFRFAAEALAYNLEVVDLYPAKRILDHSITLWDKDILPHKRVGVAYLLRILIKRGKVPSSLFRYAVEHTIFQIHTFFKKCHIRPLEKTFQDAVSELPQQ